MSVAVASHKNMMDELIAGLQDDLQNELDDTVTAFSAAELPVDIKAGARPLVAVSKDIDADSPLASRLDHHNDKDFFHEFHLALKAKGLYLRNTNNYDGTFTLSLSYWSGKDDTITDEIKLARAVCALWDQVNYMIKEGKFRDDVSNVGYDLNAALYLPNWKNGPNPFIIVNDALARINYKMSYDWKGRFLYVKKVNDDAEVDDGEDEEDGDASIISEGAGALARATLKQEAAALVARMNTANIRFAQKPITDENLILATDRTAWPKDANPFSDEHLYWKKNGYFLAAKYDDALGCNVLSMQLMADQHAPSAVATRRAPSAGATRRAPSTRPSRRPTYDPVTQRVVEDVSPAHHRGRDQAGRGAAATGGRGASTGRGQSATLSSRGRGSGVRH